MQQLSRNADVEQRAEGVAIYHDIYHYDGYLVHWTGIYRYFILMLHFIMTEAMRQSIPNG